MGLPVVGAGAGGELRFLTRGGGRFSACRFTNMSSSTAQIRVDGRFSREAGVVGGLAAKPIPIFFMCCFFCRRRILL